MRESDMLIVFTHCYHLKMRKDLITTEVGRSLFATVHGVRYIEWYRSDPYAKKNYAILTTITKFI